MTYEQYCRIGEILNQRSDIAGGLYKDCDLKTFINEGPWHIKIHWLGTVYTVPSAWNGVQGYIVESTL